MLTNPTEAAVTASVDAGKIEATCKGGVLTVKLLKSEEVKKKQTVIPITTK